MLPPRQYVKRWGFPLAALTLIGGICLVVGTVGGWTPRQEVHSETGVWDLRAFDLTRTAVTLVGDAAYVPGAFLTPAQFEEADRLGEARIGGLFQDGASYGTRRLRILVEPGAALTVADKPGEGADWVYLTVSDTTPTTPTTPDTPDTPDTTPTTPRIVAADRFGVPASDRAAAAPSDGYLILTAVADGGRLDILEHAANWVLDKGYGANEYTVGATWLMRAYTTGVFAGPLIIMGCLLALFCFHLILWLRWRPYRVSLYCAGTCLAWFISVGLTSTKPLLTLLPWLSWDIAYTLEYLSSACAGITLYLVWIGVFPWVGSKRLNALAALIFTGAVTLALVTDSLAMQAAGPWLELTVAVGFLYIIGRTFVLRVRGSHRFTRAQRLIAAGLVAFCVIIAFQMVYYRGLSPIPWSRYAINVYPLALTLLLTAAIFDEMMRTMAIARRRAGLARAKTQALEFTSALRADMVRELSHEMHTPLAVIVGFSQLAAAQAREEHMSAQITADVEAVAEEAKRLSAIVDRITLVPMADAGPLDAATRDISLADAVLHATRLYEMVIRRSGSRLETHIEPDLPLVRANLGGLTQVLFNLLTNAHKHAQADVIAVTARALPDGEVEVTVTDNGSGIRPEFLPTAFDRYAKDGQSGQGIGLAVARSIVEGFGGRIWLDSEVGVGTTAGFALPAIGE